MRELVRAIRFEAKQEFENVFEHGDHGELFYIILQGIVLVRIPNPTITHWKQERSVYKELLDWKTKHLEPRIDLAIKERFETLYKLPGAEIEKKDDYSEAAIRS
jgi:hypothetical protein